MPLEQEPERQEAGMPAVIDRLEQAAVPSVVQHEILRLGRKHKLAIEIVYGDGEATVDTLTARDAGTGEVLLHEDFKAFRKAEAKARTLGEHVDREEPRGTVIPDDIEPSLLRGEEGERGS